MTQLLARDLMTSDPYTLSREADLAQVYDLMTTKSVRHVPVTDDEGGLLGIISHRDLLQAALRDGVELTADDKRDALQQIKVGEVMVQEPRHIAPDDTAHDAGATLYGLKIGCLPVVSEGRLVGILTESDFVRYVVETLAK